MSRFALLLALVAACSTNSTEIPAPADAVPLAIGAGETTVNAGADGVVVEDIVVTTDAGVTARVRAGTVLRTRSGDPVAGAIAVGVREADAAAYTSHPDIEAVLEVYSSVPDLVFDPPLEIEIDLAATATGGAWSTYGFAEHAPYVYGTNAASDEPDPGLGKDLFLGAIPRAVGERAKFTVDAPRVVGLGFTPQPLDPVLPAIAQSTELTRAVSAEFVHVGDGMRLVSIFVETRDTGDNVAVGEFSARELQAGDTQRFTSNGTDYEVHINDNAGQSWTITLASNRNNVFDLSALIRAGDGSRAFQDRQAIGGCNQEDCTGNAKYAGAIEIRVNDVTDAAHAFEIFDDVQANMPFWASLQFVRFVQEPAEGQPQLLIRVLNYEHSVQRLAELLPETWQIAPGNRILDISASPPVDNPIVYVRQNPVSSERAIVTLEANGTERVLVPAREGVDAPKWSPQGDAVAYTAPDANGVQQIHLVSYPAGDRRQISASPGHALRFDWHPDGATLYYTVNGQIGILRKVDLDGTDEEIYRTTEGFIATVSVSGDGSALLFDRSGQIFAIGGSGTAVQLTSDGAVGERTNPVFAPVGFQFAYAGRLGEDPAEIFVSSRDSGSDMFLSREPASKPVWSPNGNWIVYDSRTGLKIARADGTLTRTLTTFDAASVAGDFEPAFSPDGEWVTFTRWDAFGFDVFKVKVDGTGLAPLFAPDASVSRFCPDW